MSDNSESDQLWSEEQVGYIPTNRQEWEGMFSLVDQDRSPAHLEYCRRVAERIKRGPQPKVPQWRLDYTEEDYRRDCRLDAEENRERRRLREQNQRRMTPPPSPPPEATAHQTLGQQNQENQQIQHQQDQGQEPQEETGVAINAVPADNLGSNAPNTTINPVTAAHSPVSSSPIATTTPPYSDSSLSSSHSIVTANPTSSASQLPSYPSRKRKRQDDSDLSSSVSPPSKRITRSQSSQETIFYEVDDHLRSRAVEQRRESGGMAQGKSPKPSSSRQNTDRALRSNLSAKAGVRSKSHTKGIQRARRR